VVVTHPARPAFAVREVSVVALALGVVMMLMANRYGPHRDELYFVSAGRRLDWGYPDQPLLTPLLARLADIVAPHSLVVLRLSSLLAVCAFVVLSAAFARLLAGGRSAQVLAAVTVAASVFTVTVGHRLSTATFDTLAWTAILLVIGHALADDRPRLWLLAGAVAGVGLNNKHAVLFLLLGVLVGVAVVQETRAQLRTPYPWLAGLLALLLWLPNLVWQAAEGWPVLELSADIAEEYGGVLGMVEMVGQALVMFSPVVAVVWVYGLVRLLREPRFARVRPVAVAFVVIAAVFLVTGGKGYYLAGAIPPLIATGCVLLAERWTGRRLVAAGAVLALSGMVAWPAFVPVLPASTYAGSFYPLLDQDQLETIGWPEFHRTIEAVIAEIPAAEREAAVVFTGNYGEAGALEWYGVSVTVYSGHNGWREWGPPADDSGPVVVVGRPGLEQGFTGCRVRGEVTNRAGADNEENGMHVWLCEAPLGSWSEAWPRLSHLDA